jgi:diphthine methyl ester acylhydrolase
MFEIETLHTFDTEYSADSVEWCQADGCEDYFSVGTYQLEEKDEENSSNNSRKGRIYLFNYDPDKDELKKCQQIETEAILDQKWKGKTLFTATSLGNVQKYQLDENGELKRTGEVSLNPGIPENLILSIDIDVNSSRVLASDSNGRISLIDMDQEQPIVHQWQAQEFEAWTCAFNRFDDNIVFSGKKSRNDFDYPNEC